MDKTKKEVRLNAKKLKNTNDKPKFYMLHTWKANSLGEFSPRKGKFWAAIADKAGENNRARKCARPNFPRNRTRKSVRRLRGTNTRHFSWIRPVGCFLVMGKLLLVSYCYVV